MYRGSEGEEEPEWVKNEREQFSLYRDKDRDGYLNTDEVGNVYYSLCCWYSYPEEMCVNDTFRLETGKNLDHPGGI